MLHCRVHDSMAILARAVVALKNPIQRDCRGIFGLMPSTSICEGNVSWTSVVMLCILLRPLPVQHRFDNSTEMSQSVGEDLSDRIGSGWIEQHWTVWAFQGILGAKAKELQASELRHKRVSFMLWLQFQNPTMFLMKQVEWDAITMWLGVEVKKVHETTHKFCLFKLVLVHAGENWKGLIWRVENRAVKQTISSQLIPTFLT